MNLSSEQISLMGVFFPYALQKYMERGAGRFVHYTNAEAAVSMVRNKNVWMRNATAVNDFMEIEHGLECLTNAYNGAPGTKLKQALDSIFPGFIGDLENKINGWIPHFRTDTYITCVSEHSPSEDRTGRLSMWRAYGSNTGVAVVLNNTPFLTQSNALNAYTSPVAYWSKEQFAQYLSSITVAIESNSDFLNTLGQEEVMTYVFSMLRLAILCTKHPGFHEEREWRVIHSPKFEPSKRLTSDIQIIRGAPQRIFKIPLKNVPEEGFFGAEIPEFVERVIIGPTQFPIPIRDAIVSLLEEAGVENASSKVWASDIPLRQ